MIAKTAAVLMSVMAKISMYDLDRLREAGEFDRFAEDGAEKDGGKVKLESRCNRDRPQPSERSKPPRR
jgi:hypothetical protein